MSEGHHQSVRKRVIKITTGSGEERSITVFELTAGQVRQAISSILPGEGPDKVKLSYNQIIAMCTDLSLQMVIAGNISANEIARIINAFSEINADFLAMARKAGLILFDMMAGRLLDLIFDRLTKFFPG